MLGQPSRPACLNIFWNIILTYYSRELRRLLEGMFGLQKRLRGVGNSATRLSQSVPCGSIICSPTFLIYVTDQSESSLRGMEFQGIFAD